MHKNGDQHSRHKFARGHPELAYKKLHFPFENELVPLGYRKIANLVVADNNQYYANSRAYKAKVIFLDNATRKI